MPAPYSDNLYSNSDPAEASAAGAAAGRDDDASAASALSPSDGYFGEDDSAAVSPTSHQQQQQQQHASRRSGSTPYVPNVLVEDPTLAKEPDSKTQLAQRLINSDVAAGAGAPSASSPHPRSTHHHHNPQSYYQTSGSPSVSGASVATPSTASYSYAQSSHHRSSVQDGASQQQQQLHINTSPQQRPSSYNAHPYHGQSDAPPAYTPSSPDNNATNFNYSTFPSSTSPRMGVPEEHDRLLSPHQQEQQPFSDPPKQPLWQRIRDSHDSGSLRKKIKTILGILVFVSILLVFMGVNMSGPSYRKRIIDKSPIRIPNMDERELVWHPGRFCRDSPHNYPKETFHAGLSSDRVLFIEQTMRKRGWTEPSGPSPNVNGEVVIRPTTSSKAEIDVEIIANYEDLDIEVEFSDNGGTDHLKVTTPRGVPDHSSRDVCIQIRITAWVPEKALVNALAVSTVSLNVFIQEGLALGAENEIDFSTVAGNLIFPPNDSDVEPYKMEAPRYKYSTVSGDVKGWFPVYHKLRTATVSGDVLAQITHKDIVLKASEPCLLDVSSVSGELKIDDGSNSAEADGVKVPPRDFLVKLATTSGDITAKLFTGSSSEFVSTSGDLKLELVPVLDERWLHTSWRPLLKTESASGGHRVQVDEPRFISIPDKLNPHERPSLPKTDDDRKTKEPETASEGQEEDREVKRRRVADKNKKRGLTALESRHSSISGNLHLVYPASWEGTFTAVAMSSDITVRGKDVIVDKKKGGFVGKNISGHKGDGASSMKIDELSGNVILTIGQE